MRIKSIYLGMLATVFAASCSNEEIVETNANYNGEPIDFNSSVASSSRAVITTLGNLGDFNVYAKGIRADLGALYMTFMVGDNVSKMPAVANRASSAADNVTWTLSEDVYWPSDINNALFWAFSDRKIGEGSLANGLCVTSGSVEFLDNSGPQIKNYKPLKADITKPAGESTGWFDGDHQRDLVSAFAYQTKNPHVNLNFHHLLSQVEITAVSKHTVNSVESRIVKIKGAWLVNILSSGTLNANFEYDKEKKEAKDAPVWTPVDEYGQYGTIYTGNDRQVPIVVNGSPSPLNVLGNEGHGNLMLIPQKGKPAWDGYSPTTTGTYLLLLCRVDLAHKGDVAPGSVVSSPVDGIHYHQQFPVTTYYDEDAYGLTAIPVPVNWEIGKKYTYNIDICGENRGAGQYPPNVPEDADQLKEYLATFIPGTAGTDYVINAATMPNPTKLNIITTRAGKDVGDYVLDDPIQFEVSVSNWDNGDEWTNGTSGRPATSAGE